MKIRTKLLVTILLVATLVNTTGCSKKNVEKEKLTIGYEQQDNTFDTTPTRVIITKPEEVIFENDVEKAPIEDDIIKKEEINIESILKEYLYDENIDYKLVMNTYFNTDYDKRDALKDDYLRAVYMMLQNTEVDMKIYLQELHTLLLLQQNPGCLPTDLWFQLFGNLDVLASEYDSLYEMFFPFAIYVHELECEKTHEIDKYGIYSCDELEEEYKLKRELTSL